MMRAAAAVVVLVAGCLGKPGPPGVGDDDGGMDAPRADGPPGDRDGDTVLDEVDNCPDAANLDQRDHDSDGIGDVCDPCPHLGTGANDRDGDGVGDACDPYPDHPLDQFLWFEGFYDNVIGGWPSSPSSVWVVENGWLRQDAMDNADAYIDVPVGPFDDVLIMAGILGIAEDPGGGVLHDVSIGAGYTTSDPAQGHQCLARVESGGPQELRYEGGWATGSLRLQIPWQGVLVGTISTISFWLEGDAVWCSVDDGSGAVWVQNDTTLTPIGAHDGRVRLRTSLISAQFDYVFVARSGGN